jgi:predicted PolB exonuclease-like 3'-5' exonuclease
MSGPGDIHHRSVSKAKRRCTNVPRHGSARKPNGIAGGDVEKLFRDGRVCEISEYCESDVVNTYRVWLRYELFRGRLPQADFEASEAELTHFIRGRGNTKPHLADLM